MNDATPRPNQTMRTVKMVIGAAAVLGLVVFAVIQFNRYQDITRYNQILEELVNQGKDAEAVEAFEGLRESVGPGELRDEIDHELAQCHIRLGGAPQASLAESAKHFRRAEELDPNVIKPLHRKTLDAVKSE